MCINTHSSPFLLDRCLFVCFFFAETPVVKPSYLILYFLTFFSSFFFSYVFVYILCTLLSYLFLSSECGGILNQENGEITSPGYPNQYPLNLDCIWVILAPSNQVIQVEFRSFQLERQSRCLYDYLEVRDGDRSDMPLLGKFCGDVVPSSVKSSQNAMYIKFHSDGLTPKRGFQLKWHAFKGQPLPPGPAPTSDGDPGK